MKKTRDGIFRFVGVVLALCVHGAVYAQSGPGTVMATDWTERHAPNTALKAYDSTLLGDSIDLQSGNLSFEHVDVSLPGNSGLAVEVRRRLSPSRMQSGEFSDWQLAIPTISTKILADEWFANKRWGKVRCSGTLSSAIPYASWPTQVPGGAALPPSKYSDGVILDVPGRTQSQILDKTVSASWPTSAAKATADGWYLECIANIDGVGTEGFRAVAPNGDRYTFNVIVEPGGRKSEFDIWQLVQSYPFGNPALVWKEMGVYYDVLGVSEVTDVNGNWVRYTYDGNRRLQSISSNDGRRIDIGRTGALIGTVTANPGTGDARQWTYTYGYKSVSSYKPPSTVNGTPGTRNETWGTLTAVTLPNGRQWQFDLANLQVRPVPGTSYPGAVCKQFTKAVGVTHPDGVTGTFTVAEVQLRLGAGATGSTAPYCPNTDLGSAGSSQVSDVMVVTSKTLASPSMATSVWQYGYVDDGTQIITTISQPDNSKKVVYHPTPFDWATPRGYAKLTREELFPTLTASTPIEVRTYTYLQEASAGSNFVQDAMLETFRPVRSVETTVTLGSDWYKTRLSYNTDRNSSNYSYGFPVLEEQWSSLGGGTRQVNTDYSHNTSLWVLGLPSTTTRNGKLFDAFAYDSLGRLVQHDRFGTPWRSYGYHTGGDEAGMPSSVQDGLFRATYFRQWKRGVPQEVERADAQRLYRTVNDDGWTTSITDWRGNTTNYGYDSVGRLAGIDRPSPWTDTAVAYDYSGSTLIQTQTRGTERTISTFDAMLRPVQVLKESLSGGGGNIYVETDYDAMGRVVFTSLPSTSAGSTVGIQTSYDALGRVTSTVETAPGGGATAYEYLPGNKTRITNPLGDQTTQTASGWGSPRDGSIIKTEKPESITVDFSSDIYGNLLSIAQTKNDGSLHTSSFEYDTRLRLCRRKIPETGDSLYSYNDANELTVYAEGQASGSGCATPPSSSAVKLNYDSVGRLLVTNYPGSTPDISRSYDANGNVLTTNRGGVNWSSSYNSIDLIDSETLSVDARSYVIDHGYDNSGALVSRTFPSGRTYTFVNDGYGRPVHVLYGGVYYLSSGTYHPNGKLSALNRGSGGLYQQLLNARQLVSSIGGNWGTSLNYSYDTAGRVTQIDSPNNSYDRTLTYDGAGRLKTASGPWGSGTYTYDRLGNLTSKVLGSRTVTIQYTSVNRVDRVRDSAFSISWRNYRHNSRGSVTGDGLHNFTYDLANQPVSITGRDSGSFVYDGNLRRVKQVIDGKTVYSIYDRSGALLTRDDITSGQVTDHIGLGGQTFVRITNGTASYPLNDHLGSAYMVADQSGSVSAANTFNYTPFGEAIGNDPGNSNSQGFTGHIEDETGLTYMQARYYDPVMGRFMSADPIGYADGLNLYAYVRNDPLNRVDPTGHCGQMHATDPGRCRINPDPDGDGKANISFVNDDPNGPSTDQFVRTELANAVEGAVADTGSDININSTGRDASLGTPSNHNPGKSNAVDVNQINGGSVDQSKPDAAPLADVQAFQDAVARQPGVRENFGPKRNEKTELSGRVTDMTTAVGPQHKDHVHISSQACVRVGNSCAQK